MASTPDRIFELVEIELKRVRMIAAQADDIALLYLIDMAIMEAKRMANSSSGVAEDSAVGQKQEPN
jgi:hypothetical protein